MHTLQRAFLDKLAVVFSVSVSKCVGSGVALRKGWHNGKKLLRPLCSLG